MAGVVRDLGRRAVVVPTDITDEAQREALVSRTIDEFGRVDCLVNNAFGIPPMDPLTTLDLDGLRVAQETNVFAPLRLSALFAKALEASSGSIINVSSCVVYSSQPEYSGYKLSKGGLQHLSSSLATELGPRGIRVNSVAPSYIYEHVNKAYFDWIASESGRTHEEVYAEKAAATDLKRLATPDEVARAALFLASDLASAVTGQTLNIDCGEFHS
jgi:NAD(P)-dependent dehydrogenase (short-subunit alcohol dehydrogenase family)